MFLRRAKAYDRFRDRLMFPICNESGRGHRVQRPGAQLPTTKAAKYVNSPETPLFHQGQGALRPAHGQAGLAGNRFCHRVRGADRSDHRIRGRHQECHRAAGHGVHGPASAHPEAAASRRSSCASTRTTAGQKAAERSLATRSWKPTSPCAWRPCPRARTRIRSSANTVRRRSPNGSRRGARIIFDFQIDRLAAQFDLQTPRGKSGFSAKMAESVSLLTDPVFREAVVRQGERAAGDVGAGFPGVAQGAAATPARVRAKRT